MTLRNRQAKLGRDSIIVAAEEIFIARGYSKTTIQNIADKADVGVATIFRHFHSKLGVYIAIARRDIDDVFTNMTKIVETPPEDLAEAVLALFLVALSYTEKPISRIKTTSRFWLLFPTGDHELDKFVIWADAKARQMILDLLVQFQKAGHIPANKDLNIMTEILFHVFNANYIEWNLDHSVGLTDIEAKLQLQIPLIFENWKCETN